MARPEPTDTNAGTSYQMRQQSFSSNSGSGYTVWYFGKSNLSILMPPTIPQAKTGHLYVHLDTSRNVFLYWMLSTANQWEHVSSGAESPLKHDRVLAIRANGEPSWITRASTATTKTRKEKEIRERSVQGWWLSVVLMLARWPMYVNHLWILYLYWPDFVYVHAAFVNLRQI